MPEPTPLPEDRWFAVCPDYIKGPYLLKSQAESAAEAMDHMGNCPHDHQAVKAVLGEHGLRRLPDGRLA